MKAGYKKTHTEKTLCEDVDYKRGATSVNGQMILPFTHSPLTRSRTIRGAYLNFYCFQFILSSSAQFSHQSAACSQYPQAPWKQIHATFWLLLLYQIKINCQLFFWILVKFCCICSGKIEKLDREGTFCYNTWQERRSDIDTPKRAWDSESQVGDMSRLALSGPNHIQMK